MVSWDGCRVEGSLLMEDQVTVQWSLGKTIGVFVCCLAVAAAYYIFLDWAMMVPIQNLPFPYR